MSDNYMPDWDTYFLLIASAVSSRGNCTRRRVGAVVVDDQRRIIGHWCNGAPEDKPQCLDGGCPRGLKTIEEQPMYAPYSDCTAIHAEAGAVAMALAEHPERLARATLYTTANPCAECAPVIAGAGIPRVVSPTHIAERETADRHGS